MTPLHSPTAILFPDLTDLVIKHLGKPIGKVIKEQFKIERR